MVTSLVVAPQTLGTSPTVVAQGLSGSTPCGSFLDQEIESVFPALAGRLFTTEPPGKPQGKCWDWSAVSAMIKHVYDDKSISAGVRNTAVESCHLSAMGLLMTYCLVCE